MIMFSIIILILLYVTYKNLFLLIILCSMIYFCMKSFISKNNSIDNLNTELSTVFQNILPYYNFNSKSFTEALQSSHKLIELHKSLDNYQHKKHIIDIAKELKKNILNNLHSFFHSFPSSYEYNFEKNIRLISKILENIVDDIKQMYKKEYKIYGPDIYNPPPDIVSEKSNNNLLNDTNKHWDFYD